MVYILNVWIDNYIGFILFIIIVAVLAVITIKGQDYAINLLLVIVYDVLDIILADMFWRYFYFGVFGFDVFVLVVAIIGICIQSLWGLKVIYFDGIKGGWRTLKPDQFKDK